jgi:hypothetical protein
MSYVAGASRLAQARTAQWCLAKGATPLYDLAAAVIPGRVDDANPEARHEPGNLDLPGSR